MRTWQISKLVLLTAALTAFAGCSGSSSTGGGGGGGGGKNASSPEEAVKFQLEAAKNGDVEGYLYQLAAGPRDLMKARVAMGDLHGAWDDALDSKFPKQGGDKRQSHTFKDELKTIQNLEIVSQDPKEIKDADKVKLRVKKTTKRDGKENPPYEDDWTAIKEGGSWKLILPGMETDPETIKKLKKQAEDAKAIAEQKIREVKDGKYKSREEANNAVEEAMNKLKSSEQPQRAQPAPEGSRAPESREKQPDRRVPTPPRESEPQQPDKK